MASGTLSAALFESSSNRSPQPAVLLYATDDDRAGEEVERLIPTAGFEPVKVGGLEQSGRLEVGGDIHDLVVGPAEARPLIGGANGMNRPVRLSHVEPSRVVRECLGDGGSSCSPARLSPAGVHRGFGSNATWG